MGDLLTRQVTGVLAQARRQLFDAPPAGGHDEPLRAELS
jgi:hypothetical protein